MGREKIAVLHPLANLRAIVKIQAGKLAEQVNRHIIIRNRGVLLIIIIANVNPAIIKTNFRHPFVTDFMPANALIPAGAAFAGQAIVLVLRRRAYSQVALAIVQDIMIDMVANHTGGDFENLAMHKNHPPVVSSLGVVLPLFPAEAPFVLRKSLVIVDIHNGELSLSQRYQPVVVTRLLSLVTRRSCFVIIHVYTPIPF